MTIAYWCVLAAAIIPYIWVIAAKASKPGLNNNEPRVFLNELEGWGKRANWAQANSFEAFPAFAAAVIIASIVSNIEQNTLDALALLFVACRLLHGVFYITDKATFRSIVWFIGICSWVSIFVLSA
ncbi:MAG: MAPEG family protein [Pseudomonadales bacterium]|nr:MAPEG family protein [Pseudomonadales bacterium]